MFKSLLKFAFPVTVLGAGGATVFGITSSNGQDKPVINSPATISTLQDQKGESVPLASSSISTDQPRSVSTETLTSVPLLVRQENVEQITLSPSELPSTTDAQSSHSEVSQSFDSSHLETVREGVPQTQSLESEVAHTEVTTVIEEETLLPDDPEGNCTVLKVLPEKIQKLSNSHVAVSCRNDVDNSSLLSKWKGYFPTSLLTEKSEKFREGLRLKIDVKEMRGFAGDDSFYGEETDSELYETIFSGEKFLKKPITGIWGSTFLPSGTEDEGDNYDELAIYVVNLKKSEISDVFYVLPEFDDLV